MKFYLTLVTLAFGSFGFSGVNLTGTVKFNGSAPKKEVIRMNSDQVCLKQNSGKAVHKQDVLVNSNGTLGNVFVYVKEGATGNFPPPTDPVTFDQKGCMYTPHVFGIQVNQPLQILNSDPTMHNINSAAKQVANKFNNGMPPSVKKLDKKFTKPEVMVKIKCDVHGWMVAYAGVLEHPFFAVTDPTGGFNIKDLPPGDYTLAAWHEKLGEKTTKVTIAQTAPPVEFVF